jgi:hypothetical protein
LVYWLTLSRGNTESDEKVYSASRGQTRLLASYSELSCDDESTQCGADVFAGGRHAFVSHGGTIFQVEGSRLEPVLDSPCSSFAAVSWPYVALLHTHEISSPAGTEVRVYRLTDGKRVRTFHDAQRVSAYSRTRVAAMALGEWQARGSGSV